MPCISICRPTFDDLKEVSPEIHANLVKLLEYEDASELGLYFQVDTEGEFGEGSRQVNICAFIVHMYFVHSVQ